MSILGLLATGSGTPLDPEPTRPESLDGPLTTRLAAWGRVSHHKAVGPVTSTTEHIAPVEADGLVLHWGNVLGDPIPTYVSNPDPITVTASITTDSGTHPVTWGGLSSVTIAGGALAASDPVGWVTAGGTIAVTATVTSTGSVPCLSGWSDGTGAYLVGPLAITGGTPTPDTTHRWLILGDSVSEGVGDDLHGRSGQFGTGGYPERLATKAGVAYLGAAASGERYAELDSDWTARVGDTLASRCDSAFVGYGINDILVYTAAQNSTAFIERWHFLKTKGIGRIYQATILPRTNAAGTVVDGDPTQRNAFNAWLRDGAPGYWQGVYSRWQARPTGSMAADTYRIGGSDPVGGMHPLDGVLDVHAVAAGTSDPNLWKPGWTSDGVHPNATGHAAIAAALDLP